MSLFDSVKSWFTKTPSKKYPSGSTFLGVPAKSLSTKKIQEKAKKDKQAADSRKDIVNEAIKQQNKKIANTLSYPRLAEKAWENSVQNGSSSKIVQSVQQNNKQEEVNKPTSQVNRGYRFGGQFGGVAQQARDIYHGVTSYDLNNVNDWGRLGRSRAKGDLTTDRGLQNVYYTNRLDDNEHTRLINQGEDWLRGADVEAFLGLGKIETEEDLRNAERKYKQYEQYIQRYVKPKRFYNTEVGEFQTHEVITDDAPLPSWVPATTANIMAWEYYKGYQGEVSDGLRNQADKLTKERAKYKKHTYKSAFNPDGTTNLQPYPTGNEGPVIDSLADVVYASLGGANFFDTYKQYVKEYHLNPLLAGKFTTVIGNHLWNLMDTMDFASRGVRAFTAGEMNLGGTQHSFTGQKDFWVRLNGRNTSDAEHAQKIFLAHGGDTLLKRSLGDKTAFADNRSDEELKAELAEAFNDPVFKAQGITWEEVYDAIKEQYYGESSKTLLSRALSNVKEAYTDPEAEFNADTGSTVANMLVETVLDPGLIVGGMAKTRASRGAHDIANLVLKGKGDDLAGVLRQVSNLPDEQFNAALNSKPVRKALRAFSGSNEGRNIIFKDAKKLRADTDALATVLKNAGVLSDEAVPGFKAGMLNALTGTQTKINGKIIGAQLFDEVRKNRKAVKVAANIDRAIDTVDMAIIKSSFIEPFVISKIWKGGRNINERVLRNVIAQRKLDVNQAGQAVVEGFREGGLDVGLKTASDRVAKNIEKDVKFAEQVEAVKNQFRNAAARIEDVNTRLYKLEPDEALQEVSDVLNELSGTKVSSIEDIDAVIADVRKNYAIGNDMDDVFDSLKRTYNAFTDSLERQDYRYRKAFLAEVRDVNNADELAIVVNKYSDKIDAHSMRVDISDVLPNKSIVSEADIDNILQELDNGLLAERSATSSAISSAAVATQNASTTLHQNAHSPSYILYELHRLPAVNNALQHLENYPMLRKLGDLDELLYAADKHENMVSLDLINTRLAEVHKDIAVSSVDLIHLGMNEFVNTELKQISDELCELRSILDEGIALEQSNVITTFHLDKQAKYDSLINDHRFTRIFGEIYETAFKPAIDKLATKSVQNNDVFNNSPIYKSLMRIANMRYSYQRYRRFVNEISSLNISDEAKYAIRNGLFGNYGESSKKLVEVTRRPGKVRRWLNEMMYNEFSASKVGMDTLSAKLASIDNFQPDAMIADYVDEIKSNPVLDDWYRNIINGDPADPNTYLQKQVLSTILMDPDAIRKFNKYDKAPIFLHVSTSGLTDDATITGISYYKWREIPVDENGKFNMESVYNALNNNSVTYNRVMSDADIKAIDNDTLYSIYKNSIGERSQTPDELRELYKKTFGATEEHPHYTSERDILEKFFDDIYEDTVAIDKGLLGGTKSIETVVPTFVVHDLDGFNIPFINRRSSELADTFTSPRISDYLSRLSYRAENTSINTFEQLRSIVNDNMLSDEEFKEVEQYINTFAEDLATRAGAEFNMLDLQQMHSEMLNLSNEISKIPSAPEEDEIISILRSSIASTKFGDAFQQADLARTELGILDDEAKQIYTITDAVPNPKILNGADTETVRSFYDSNMQNALHNLSNRLGFDFSFEDAPNAHWGGQFRYGSSPYTIAINTNVIHDMKSSLVHELRHNLSITDDFGARFKETLLQNAKYGMPDESKAFRQILNFKFNQYQSFDPLFTMDEAVEELNAELFASYFNDAGMLYSVQDYMMRKGLLDTAEGRAAYDSISDLLTIIQGDFQLKRCTQAPDEYFNSTEWIRNTIINNGLIDDAQMKDEFIGSLVNLATNRDRLSQFMLEAFASHNPVKDAALRTGERIINASDRLNVRSIMRYFSTIASTGTDDVLSASFSDLHKMAGISRWVEDKLKYSVRLGAEEYLEPMKNEFDRLLAALKNLALNSKGQDGYFTYLKDIRIPESATESYLLCQKLYDDFLKYWLNADYSKSMIAYTDTYKKLPGNLSEEAVRTYMLAEFVDNMHFGDVIPNKENEAFTSILRLFEGEGQSLVFKDVPTEYISNDAIFTSHGKLKEGIDLARKLKRGYTQMKGIFQEQDYLDSVLRASGIVTKKDFGLGLMYRHTADFIDYLNDNNLIDNPRFRTLISDISDLHMTRAHNIRIDRLKVDGHINTDKLLQEMLYNNTNHIAFQKVYYTDSDLTELRNLVRHANSDGMDFLKIAEDRGTISVYLTNKCEVIRGTGDNGREIRYIHKIADNSYGARYYKPVMDNIALPTVDELKDLVDNDALMEFQQAYNMLRECWNDVALLSDGASNGTLGRLVSYRDQEEYYKIANNFMPDLLSSKGLRESGMYGRIMYDPGFMLQGDFDIFTEYLHTMETQAENFKVTGGFINNVFGSGNEMGLNELAQYVSDKELVNYFNENADFVLCSLIPDENTKLGVRVNKINLNSAADVATAKQMKTAVLPYDMFLEISDNINKKQYPSDLNRAINKLMLVYKAGALFHPGTWVRNFIDATQKSATDLGESPLNIFSTFYYELEAMRDIYKFHKAMKYGDDFLNEANWDMIRTVFKTNMSYDDFNLLRGMLDGSQYVSKADNLRKFSTMKNGGREVISGDNIGLRNLDESDILQAYKLTEKQGKLPLEQKRFIELYTGAADYLNDTERELYEASIRQISNTMHDRKAVLSLSNAVSAAFVPFNMTEITIRFAQMRKLNELGFSHNQALKRVHMTQFRAADRYSITNNLEYIIPFITFKFNNLKYWMRMMEENPAYFKYFQKLYGNIAEDTIEQYEQKGQQLDYESSWMLKTGGIPIGNGQYYFKLNPSFFDAMETMYGFPTDLVDRQNPLLRLATRASMYELGLDSKYIFQELNLEPEDANLDVKDIVEAVAPRLSKLSDLDKMTGSGFRTWLNDLGPNMDTLYKLLPSMIGRNSYGYAGSDFEDYQKALEKDGLWYDSNLGQVVPLSEKNEAGMNNPAISWMDRNNYMMEHFNKIWDSNLGKFVNFWERTEGGLNQYFDFTNDPDAWDRLCAEYARKGMKFDYNTKHFIPEGEWRSTGLNNPDITFEERVRLMKEKFGFEWDSNQNCFIDPGKGKHYISGGLNDVHNFRDVMLYRYVLFGERYNKETHHFEQVDDAKVVVIDSLFKTPEYNNYFAMLGLPRLANLTDKIHLNSDGLFVTSDGKYVLMTDNDYNRRVFQKLSEEYGGMFAYNRGRRYFGWKNYSFRKFSKRPRKPYRGRTMPKTYYSAYYWQEPQEEPVAGYQFNFQYHSPKAYTRVKKLITPPLFYPYGGGYNKFSFYNRY